MTRTAVRTSPTRHTIRLGRQVTDVKYHPNNKRKIVGAPGFEDFTAWIIPGLHEVALSASSGMKSVVVDADGEIYVLNSKHVVKEES